MVSGAYLGTRGTYVPVEGETQMLQVFKEDERGQGLAEYALILALIAIVAIIALIFLGQQVSSILSTVGSSI